MLSSIYFFVYFHRTSPAVIADEFMREFAVSALAVGLLSPVYFYPYAILQIPVGVLSDTKGPRWTVMIFTLLTFFGVLTLSLANSYEMAVASRLLIGIGVAGVYVPTIKIISVWFKQNEFATATCSSFCNRKSRGNSLSLSSGPCDRADWLETLNFICCRDYCSSNIPLLENRERCS
ncbi:MFS transporter [Rhodococcoides navarretei]|uniref:MFS transporter n=1 Tax=Rhodococcus navarretei TaxID=3128981 RepID=UPI003BF977E0